MKKNNQAYSVIVAMLLIGFLLVLTTTVFSLVLRELRDNRILGDSIKAFAGAESGQEIALLNIKEQGYGFNKSIELGTNDSKSILADSTSFHKAKDVMIAYDLNTVAQYNGTKYEYSESLGEQAYSIIPLFSYDDAYDISVENYNISINMGQPRDLIWNLVHEYDSIAGTGNNFLDGEGRKIDPSNGESQYIRSSIQNFLNGKNRPYLILFNTSNTAIEFTITSDKKFSKPKIKILSSAQVGRVKQNLYTDYDNTEFLNLLKYAALSE